MPCYRMPNGVLCVGNDSEPVKHKGKVYLFEWTEACGWLRVNKNGGECLSPAPHAVWDLVDKLKRPGAE